MTRMPDRNYRILMLLENESVPEDCRVYLEAMSLVQAGYDVTVICPVGESTRKFEMLDEIRVYRYPKLWEFGGFLGYLFEYSYSLIMMFLLTCFVLVRNGFDCIHVHTPPDLTAIIAIPFQWTGKHFVFDHHDLSPELYQIQKGTTKSGLVHRMLLKFERLACRNADRLIATNESQQRIEIERCGASPERCHIVRNGPNEIFLRDVEPLEELVHEGLPILGYVGAIGVQDGVDTLLRALHHLRFKMKRSDFLAVIVGDGPAFSSLKTLAKELGLTEHIRFTGMIPFRSVPAHVAAFDVCLTPDPSNPYNDSCTTIKTMEYMALRKPIVCFRTHENEVTAADTAIYIEDNDVPQYARAIARLLDDPLLRKSMGEAARSRIEDGLTWYHQQEELIELYRLLSESHLPMSSSSHRR
ncbi:MAG: glycosyltransferase involved in cell wall biosynthesis [Candidatus Pelagisphaera sp.]|jgi:glycosyltransferase involved in cell wall biosynthesis